MTKTKFQGTPTKLAVRVSRKLSDGAYGSYEVLAELETNLAQDANLEEAFAAHDAWLTAAVAASVRNKQDNIARQTAQPTLPMEDIPPLPMEDVVYAAEGVTVEEVRTPAHGGVVVIIGSARRGAGPQSISGAARQRGDPCLGEGAAGETKRSIAYWAHVIV